MKAKVIVLIVAAVVLIGGGAAAYFVTTGNGDSGPAASSAQSEQEAAGGRTSIDKLLAQNKNITCTYSGVDDAGNNNSGTVYIAGERMRGNFTLEQEGKKPYKSNILQNDTYQYGWKEGAKTGFQVELNALRQNGDVPTSDEGEQTAQTVDTDRQFDFDCSDWTVDESMFEVPAGIKFTDFTNQLQQSQQQLQNVCQGISDPSARAACESAQ